MSPGTAAFSDLKFLSVICEDSTGGVKYSLATIFEETDRTKGAAEQAPA